MFKKLHMMKIIHKDVKKSNTLYYPTFKYYVLSDFGLTHKIKENIWLDRLIYLVNYQHMLYHK